MAMMRTTFERAVPQDYMTRLADSEFGRSYKSIAADALGVDQGDVVVDMGCGPGADLPGFARAAGPSGTVIGLDHDPSAVALARKRVAGSATVSVRLADMHATGLPGRSADRVYTDRALQHVADPLAALMEAHRVLRPSGRAVFSEPDWDTLIVDYPDLEVPRAYRQFIVDAVVRNACIGHQLPGLLPRAGFTVREVIPFTTVFQDAAAADKVFGFHRVTERAVQANYLDRNTADDWLESLATRPFFASAALFIVVAEPQASAALR